MRKLKVVAERGGDAIALRAATTRRGDRDKGVKILVLRHQDTFVERPQAAITKA
ncbi:hypothetical protein [Saccharothrix sp. ALI-22-I]|uniref:hypothetical protein n=1 Tax=Saccharothrix sp. ALI-22-I TaxID=1933778 RepID=UPI0015C2C93B|nr:hypothetical protein [Saccharothrix sp. ALI-22-I]